MPTSNQTLSFLNVPDIKHEPQAPTEHKLNTRCREENRPALRNHLLAPLHGLLGIRIGKLRHDGDEVQSTHGAGSGGLENAIPFHGRCDGYRCRLCSIPFYQCTDEVVCTFGL